MTEILNFREQTSFTGGLRKLSGAVCVVTANNGRKLVGCTVSSATGFCVDPEILIVSLNRKSNTIKQVMDCERFALSVLSSSQERVAVALSRKQSSEIDKFAEISTFELPSGSQAIENSVAVFDCEFDQAITKCSHVLVFAEVKYSFVAAGQPLVYFDGSYQKTQLLT